MRIKVICIEEVDESQPTGRLVKYFEAYGGGFEPHLEHHKGKLVIAYEIGKA